MDRGYLLLLAYFARILVHTSTQHPIRGSGRVGQRLCLCQRNNSTYFDSPRQLPCKPHDRGVDYYHPLSDMSGRIFMADDTEVYQRAFMSIDASHERPWLHQAVGSDLLYVLSQASL